MTCNRNIYQVAIKNQRKGMMAGVKGHRKKVTRLEVTWLTFHRSAMASPPMTVMNGGYTVGHIQGCQAIHIRADHNTHIG